MSRNFRLAYLAHSLRSDWNNGNAHFLRGLLRAIAACGHDVTIFEPAREWSIENLEQEPAGQRSLDTFAAVYPDLRVNTYDSSEIANASTWRSRLADYDVVILHEWHPPALAQTLLMLRDELGYRLLFHDTHHRASSSPEQIHLFGVDRFDGVLAFGEALRQIYRKHFGITRVWTLHEAADVTVFKPHPGTVKRDDVVWIGNWGDGERSREIQQFLLDPASEMWDHCFAVYGVRYPDDGLQALQRAGVEYRGYLPNLDAPATYAAARLTVHIPRQQYATAMTGIPTIRVFEALACGIPLVSAPWRDTEELFRAGDYLQVRNTGEMLEAIRLLLTDETVAARQAAQGLATVLGRHTCDHRAEQLIAICKENLL